MRCGRHHSLIQRCQLLPPLRISLSLCQPDSTTQAGGVRQVPFAATRGFYYPNSAAILLTEVATVTVMDVLSQRLRQAAI